MASPQSAPFFALQAPLWQRAASGPPLLALVNIKIVKNVVGLFVGKASLQALCVTSRLRPGRGCSGLYILDTKLFVDAGSHFLMHLRLPSPILPEQADVSLQKGGCDILRSVEASALSQMSSCRARPHALDQAIFRDDSQPLPQAHSPARSSSSARSLSGPSHCCPRAPLVWERRRLAARLRSEPGLHLRCARIMRCSR